MLESAISTIEKYNMLSLNDRVVVAVSGGPDSMALLHLLYSLRESYCLYIHAAHINHMLRGDESDRDTFYVEEFCSSHDIPCSIKHVDITALSKKEGISLEEAGRKARYDFFSQVARDISASKIALAHNMNDQAETVLMRIMRGTGLEGLGGIKPVREGIYIRPLIHTVRSDIEDYCDMHNIHPRIDSTNLRPVYARNRVRLELIPYIKKNYNSNIEHILSSMAELVSEDNDFIDGYVNNIYKEVALEKIDKISLDICTVKMQHASIKKRLLRRAIRYVKGNLTGIEGRHIELVLSIVENGSTGSAVELPGMVKARVSYGSLDIILEKGHKSLSFSYELPVPGEVHVPEIGGMLCSRIIYCDFNIYQDNRFVKYFDYDKIKGNLIIRSRREGDYMVPLGFDGRKKIKELFIDSKVPKDERDRIPIIACNDDIMWVVGYRMSENYKVDKNTRNVLKLEFLQRGGNKDV